MTAGGTSGYAGLLLCLGGLQRGKCVRPRRGSKFFVLLCVFFFFVLSRIGLRILLRLKLGVCERERERESV